jgi:hypothetical protein
LAERERGEKEQLERRLDSMKQERIEGRQAEIQKGNQGVPFFLLTFSF